MKKVMTLTDLLLKTKKLGDKTAYTFVTHRDYEGSTISYEQLIEDCEDLAFHLCKKGKPGDRVLLMFPYGLDFIKSFYGVIMAGRIAVPIDIPRTRGVSDRVERILQDCEANLVLTVASLIPSIREFIPEAVHIVAMDELSKPTTSKREFPKQEQDDAVLLQYTSGSTGAPKGVIITHENILHNQKLIHKAFSTDAKSMVVGWLPYYHDMGLIGNIVQTIYAGASAVLFSPRDFLLKPKMWLDIISKYKGTVSGAPDFAYRLCTERISVDDISNVDLSSWSVAFCGAEMINYASLKNFADKFKRSGFNPTALQPCYGMAEATLLISSGVYHSKLNYHKRTLHSLAYQTKNSKPLNDQSVTVVSCGKPNEFGLLVINSKNEKCKDGAVGEIWVRGKSMVKGYWKNASLDFKKYHENEGPFFATGDLGYVHKGELFVTGRKKELIIIHGQNYYPYDIENTVSSVHENLITGRSVAFGSGDFSDGKLIVVCEVQQKNEKNVGVLSSLIQKRLGEQMHVIADDIVLIKKNGLPRTTSGKLQRFKTRELYLNKKLKILEQLPVNPSTSPVEPLNSEEKTIVECLEMLEGRTGWSKNTNFFVTGINSLKMATLATRLSEQMEKEIPLDLLYKHPEVSSLAKAIRQLEGTERKISPSKDIKRIPLSGVQTGFYFDYKINPTSSYNIVTLLPLKGKPDPSVLSSSLNCLIADQEILRTVFHSKKSKVYQEIVTNTPAYKIYEINCTRLNETEVANRIKQEAAALFDLSIWPLFKVKLFALSDGSYKLLTVFHHIIADGQTVSLFLNALIYKNKSHILTTRPYRKYITWYKEYEQSNEYNEDRSYWMDQFQGKDIFELPYLIKTKESATAESVFLTLNTEECQRVIKSAEAYKTSRYTILLSVFMYLLFRISGRRDVTVGVPVHGRIITAFQSMLGLFMNSIMIRTEVGTTGYTAKQLIKRVDSTLREGLQHQKFPLNELLKGLYAEKDSQRKRYLTRVYFNGLNFSGDQLPQSFQEAFKLNPGVAPQQDINCYVFDNKGEISIRLDYDSSHLVKVEAERLLFQFQHLLNESLSSPDIPLNKLIPTLPISDEEREKIFSFSSGKEIPFPSVDLVTMIREKVETNPQAIAYVHRGHSITYREFWEKSDTIASLLIKNKLVKGELVPILLEKTLNFPIAVFGCIKTETVYVPIDPEWPADRINMLLADLDGKVLLTESGLNISSLRTGTYALLEVDNRTVEGLVFDKTYSYDPEALIYGFYTSGTTGKPKCTLNLQKGVLNRLNDMNRRFNGGNDNTILFSDRQSFDASFWQMFWPLTNGARVIIPNNHVGFDPIDVVNLVQEYGITLLDFVPSAFKLFVEYLENQNITPTQLKSVELCLLGGEAISFYDVKKFMKKYPDIKVYNTYGPTETSIAALGYHITTETTHPVPIGKPFCNYKAIVLDEDKRLTPIGTKGELYLGGICVGAGYHGLPEKTNEVFVKNPFPEIDSDILYKTGDTCYTMPDGNIQFIGRKDDQIKINAIRIELGEIENAIAAIPGVKKVLVKTYEINKTTHLCAYFISKDEVNQDTVRNFLQQKLPQYMRPSYLIKLQEFPLLTNGKVDKLNLPSPSTLGAKIAATRKPVTKTEIKLAKLFKQVLELKRLPGADQDFFQLGGDSLKATRLQLSIKGTFDKSVQIGNIFENPTVGSLALVVGNGVLREPSMEAEKVTTNYPLTKSQKRMWILSQTEDVSIAYNVPALFKITGPLDIVLLKEIYNTLLQKYEVLRTTFPSSEGEPLQRVMKHKIVEIEVVDLSGSDEEEILQEAQSRVMKPFDLEKDLLIRTSLLKTGMDTHYLFLCMHHIITDAWSIDLLLREFFSLYNKTNIKAIDPIHPQKQYRDFVSAKALYQDSAAYEDDRRYWVEKFKNGVPRLNWDTDFKRPIKRTYKGETMHLALNKEMSSEITSFCKEHNCTAFHYFVSSLSLLLYRYTSQSEIALGFPVSGRNFADSEHQPGLFINTLVLLTKVNGSLKFLELLNQCKSEIIASLNHQRFDFQDFITNIKSDNDTSRNPVYDIMIVMESLKGQNKIMRSIEGMTFEKKEIPKANVVADFYIVLREFDNYFSINIEYNKNLYSKRTISRFLKHFENLLSIVRDQPNLKVFEVSYMEQSEVDLLCKRYNETKSVYPRQSSITELFKEQVLEYREKVAVSQAGVKVTYEELEQIGNYNAHILLQTIGKNDTIIPIISSNPLVVIVGALAVLKAGKSYMPIDPNFPIERIELMLSDTGSSVGLCEEDTDPSRFPDLKFLPVTTGVQTDEVAEVLETRDPLDPCNVMYTSSSTGKPKGIVSLDRNVIRLVKNNRLMRFESSDKRLKTGAITFDLSTMEIWGTLLNGATLYIPDKGTILNHNLLQQELSENAITTIFLTTRVFEQLAATHPDIFKDLQYLGVGGEKLHYDAVVKVRQACPSITICNQYGPLENGIVSMAYNILDEKIPHNIPIGKPISNTTAYILDDYLQLVPEGVAGVLYLGGDGIPQGYLDKVVTQDQFIGNPFVKGEKLYNSGDVVKWLPGGDVQFIGRKDRQIIINGIRIEHGEIESILNEYPGIRNSVVVCEEGHITSYVISDDTIEETDVKRFLSNYLLGIMIPMHIIPLEAIPFNTNGKIDYNKLPKPDQVKVHYPEPTDPIENELRKLWAEVLDINAEEIGLHHNFFDLGSNSLILGRMITHIKDRFSVQLTYRELIHNQQIPSIVDLIKEKHTIDDSENEIPVINRSMVRVDE